MRILWLKTELLHPIDKGGKIRTYQMLKHLRREHHVTYLTLDDGEADPHARERAAEYCHDLVTVPHRARAKFSPGFYADLARNLASPLPYALKKYESAEMRREIARRARPENFDVVVCDFLTPSVNLPKLDGCATMLFQHNVEAMIWRRHYETQTNPLKRAYLYDQWRKMRSFELAACGRFDHVVAVSREDRETMSREYGVKTIADVPTGVDTEFFRPQGGVEREPANLVFTGSMDWLPNEDAIRYFTTEIMPRIKQSVPRATLTVVGRNPSPALVDMGARDPSIKVTGRVEDVRPFMERATAYIVPIRVGGGTRLKIYEAMAMEMPVISTTIGAEGLPVTHERELLIADTPEAFASAVVQVLSDERLARGLGERAATTVRTGFGWDKVATRFAEECEQALRLHRDMSVGSTLENELNAVT